KLQSFVVLGIVVTLCKDFKKIRAVISQVTDRPRMIFDVVQTDRPTNRPTHRRTDKRTDMQTDRYTDGNERHISFLKFFATGE
ncbi:unnamed protein product, partial [Acanthoscelides obtectus]